MKFSSLVDRITGDGADAWEIHYAARAAQDRGEDVIILSVGDPAIDPPPPVLERAIEALRAGDTHYTPVPGRDQLREAIARAHRERTGQAVEAANVIFLAGAQNALFIASLCLAGPGDEVIAFEPLYPTYPATLEVSGARMVRVPAPAASGFRVDLAALESAITPRTRAIFFATPNNPSGAVIGAEDLAAIGELARRHALWVVSDEVYAGLGPAGAGDHRQQSVQDARNARLARRVVGGTPTAGRSRRSVGLVHAVRSARVHSRSCVDRGGSCRRRGIAHARFLRQPARCGPGGTRWNSRAAMPCAGRRHVHVDRRQRHRAV